MEKAKLVLSAMKELGIQQKDVGEKAHVSKANVSQQLRGAWVMQGNVRAAVSGLIETHILNDWSRCVHVVGRLMKLSGVGSIDELDDWIMEQQSLHPGVKLEDTLKLVDEWRETTEGVRRTDFYVQPPLRQRR